MTRAAIALSAVIAVAACAETQEAADQIARRSAKAAVDETLVRQFPQVDAAQVTPFSDCIIDNASSGEIAQFARAAVFGVTDETGGLVLEIVQRPATIECLAGRAPELLLL